MQFVEVWCGTKVVLIDFVVCLSYVIAVTISCFQTALVSWAVSRNTTLDLLTVGNMTFSGDPRYSIIHQKHNNWVLVIKNVDMMDEGRYICMVQTFPEQSLSVFVRVHGELVQLFLQAFSGYRVLIYVEFNSNIYWSGNLSQSVINL